MSLPRVVSLPDVRQSSQQQKSPVSFPEPSSPVPRLERPLVVIKIGTSSLLASSVASLALSTMARVAETTHRLRTELGYNVILVSSGAVGAGAQKLGILQPKSLAEKQALAAVGQVRLMRQYSELFSAMNTEVAQVLLTWDDLGSRARYQNSLQTFQALLQLDVVPIVNENDTVAVNELRFGDNDTLAALVANMTRAQWCIMLTDVDALYTANPHTDPNATPLRQVTDLDALMERVSIGGAGSGFGTGGMITKIRCAKLCTACGVRAAIIASDVPEKICELIQTPDTCQFGTQFLPKENGHNVKGRKRWLLALKPSGVVQLDSGAVKAVLRHKSLFAAGMTGVTGDFHANEVVSVVDGAGLEIGRGLANYDSSELRLVLGKHSKEVVAAVGYQGSEHVIHRDNIVLLR